MKSDFDYNCKTYNSFLYHIYSGELNSTGTTLKAITIGFSDIDILCKQTKALNYFQVIKTILKIPKFIYDALYLFEPRCTGTCVVMTSMWVCLGCKGFVKRMSDIKAVAYEQCFA